VFTIQNLLLPKTKLIISTTLRKLILGNLIGNIPNSIIRDIKEIVELDIYKNNIQVIKKLDDSHIEKYNFLQKHPISFPRDKAYESKYMYKVNDVYLSTRTGVIWSDSKILLESVGSMRRLLGWGGVLVDFLMRKSSTKIQESVIVCPDTGYYHWLLEVLPNVLHLLQELEEDVKIVIPKKSGKYLTTALKYILKDKYENKIIFLDKPTKVKTVYFAYYESQSGYVRKIDRDILKKYFLDFEQAKENNRKIYISRLKAPKRSLGNEKEVEDTLKKEGFEIVYAEDLNWLEQIKLYNNCSFIIAPHGAGLGNVIWSQKSTKILEIFPYDKFHFCFATLAKSNELKYDYLICNKDKNSSGRVDIEQLLNKLVSL
jgi:hypothetical protein